MQIELLRHDGRDWSRPFPALDSDRTLVLVFGASSFLDNAEPINELVAAFPSSHIVGCSSSGEIFEDTISDDSLAVAVAQFEATDVRVAVTPIGSESSVAAGVELARQLAEPDLSAVLVLSEGLDVNGSDLVEGLNEHLPGVTITGGLAGDGDRFEQTWTLVDGKPAAGFATAVGLYGDRVQVGHGSQGGWDRFGPERIVTRSRDNVLYELDGEAALELYKTYLGELADGLPATGLLFPLALRAKEGDSKQLVRTILAVDEESQSLVFAGDIPEGHLAQLMQANFDRLVGGAEAAAERARILEAPAPFLTIAISCVGRRLVLGERTEDELEAVSHVLPDGNHQVGFYSYGEISPYAEGTCDLHNQTMTLTVVTERA
ncbi:MAG: FIST C-terminal domain-containing protein [Acidimicrobiia bacterium]|nr:FIST C-terminal domain-containing protein [Acidimicrobiia bacterium]